MNLWPEHPICDLENEMSGRVVRPAAVAAPAPGTVETFYVVRGDYVAWGRGASTPVLLDDETVPPATRGLWRRLQTAGARSITGQGIVITITHGYPPRVAYRQTDDPNTGPMVAPQHDRVVQTFMAWYLQWRAHVRTLVGAR